ncbi:hypothetical protein GVN20_06885 [Runella sp. CRIBMP]|uniref:nucleotidyl transferase AbiEii/AbiGii toxin family protein n=1 Tax=Runella sp. CRIBMP TaxID=2683261 RepID=UPI0014125B9A|nr:nucleotidyl transferase AbiEii/AbiGii toxin family protein [Runella sp. CRIBMP]NBB19074.1 hypothetical protein [Runella sp. CRIBMP]
MNTYNLNYSQLRQNSTITEMLSALERGLEKFSIDFYLVGAVARDAWMGIHNKQARRTTGDIDFAVLINNMSVYEALKDYLIQVESFSPSKENAFVLIWKDQTEVDLMPFGAIEDHDGKVSMEGVGFTSLQMPGFSEIYEEGLPQLVLENSHKFKFCTLPGIVLLKFIAWDDRPERRRKDIKDISDILHHFFDMYDEQIWENHNDLFEDENDNLKHIAAQVMGREISKIAKRNEKLFNRISTILNNNTDDVANSRIATIMTEDFGNSVEDNVLLLRQLKQGLKE